MRPAEHTVEFNRSASRRAETDVSATGKRTYTREFYYECAFTRYNEHKLERTRTADDASSNDREFERTRVPLP